MDFQIKEQVDNSLYCVLCKHRQHADFYAKGRMKENNK